MRQGWMGEGVGVEEEVADKSPSRCPNCLIGSVAPAPTKTEPCVTNAIRYWRSDRRFICWVWELDLRRRCRARVSGPLTAICRSVLVTWVTPSRKGSSITSGRLRFSRVLQQWGYFLTLSALFK